LSWSPFECIHIDTSSIHAATFNVICNQKSQLEIS